MLQTIYINKIMLYLSSKRGGVRPPQLPPGCATAPQTCCFLPFASHYKKLSFAPWKTSRLPKKTAEMKRHFSLFKMKIVELNTVLHLWKICVKMLQNILHFSVLIGNTNCIKQMMRITSRFTWYAQQEFLGRPHESVSGLLSHMWSAVCPPL